MAPDEKNVYGEEGSWHSDRLAGNLIYFCEVLGCRIVGDVHFSNKTDFNNHRDVIHNLPPIGKLPTGYAKSRYKPGKYDRVRRDINKVLQRNTNSKRWREMHKALTKYGKEHYHDLPQEVKDDIEKEIERYDSLENKKIREEKHNKREYIKSCGVYISGTVINAGIESQEQEEPNEQNSEEQTLQQEEEVLVTKPKQMNKTPRNKLATRRGGMRDRNRTSRGGWKTFGGIFGV